VLVLRSRPELERLATLRASGALTLVPTMGSLHEGHLSLIERARTIGPTLVSIFVNPAQFGPGEDYAAYPRDLAHDLELLEPLGVNAVFAPSAAEMYRSADTVRIEPGTRADVLCGAGRPGHFAGVLTVVAKLLNLLRPEVAIFGRKDAQQCLVIAEMVEALDFRVRLIDHPTATSVPRIGGVRKRCGARSTARANCSNRVSGNRPAFAARWPGNWLRPTASITRRYGQCPI